MEKEKEKEKEKDKDGGQKRREEKDAVVLVQENVVQDDVDEE